ncbi:MAG: TatD family deoxyribonuclease [Nitrospirae bacterium]|nr:MAG: TatD family deoxyribonuclease [Nitrospirota bacterium]
MHADCHTHLTDPAFDADREAVVARARAAGVGWIVTNGTDPPSNRAALELARTHPEVYAALGIYPVDAVAAEHRAAGGTLPWEQRVWDVEAELAFIDAHAEEAIAIGECGLDAHWVPEQLDRQREVFAELIAIARRHDRPLVVHSRRAEAEAIDLLVELGAERVDLHCFGGRFALARRAVEAGFYCSIPATLGRNQLFQKMARELPLERLLTETDAPYLAPERGRRNEPANVAATVARIAELRGLEVAEVEAALEANFRRLFRP